MPHRPASGQAIVELAYSPDGRYLAVASEQPDTLFQKVSVLAPLGATTPIPVTAARRGLGSLIVSSPWAG